MISFAILVLCICIPLSVIFDQLGMLITSALLLWFILLIEILKSVRK